MTQELSENQKRKIEEEENYRQELRQHLNYKPDSSKKHGCLWSFIAFGLIILIIASFSGGKKGTSQQKEASGSAAISSEEETKRKEEEKQRKITELGDTFCKERSGPYARYVNIDDFILMFEKAGEIVNLRPVGNKPPEKDKCEKVMKLCLGYWSEDDCGKIAARKIWMGMTTNQLELSWGLPNDRNETVTQWGIHTQWVYGDFGPYVYLEGKNDSDLKVTSWQD